MRLGFTRQIGFRGLPQVGGAAAAAAGDNYLDFSTIGGAMLIDDNNHLTLNTNELIFTEMPENEIIYAGYDGGEGYFSGDWEVTFQLSMGLSLSLAAPCFCTFSNTLDDARACDLADDGVTIFTTIDAEDPGVYKIQVLDMENDSGGEQTVDLDVGSVYYIKFTRDDSEQTATLEVYNDEDMEDLVDSVACVDINQSDYQYFYVISNYNDDGDEWSSGVISDMTITPTVS